MSRGSTRRSGLTGLLDALERDLLAASTGEICDALDETEQTQDTACQDVRLLLNEAMVANEKVSAVTIPYRIQTRAGLHKR